MNQTILRTVALTAALGGTLGAGLATGAAANADPGTGDGQDISAAVHTATPEFGPCENNGVRAYRFQDNNPAASDAKGHSYDFLLSVFLKGGRQCAGAATVTAASTTGDILSSSTQFIDTSGTSGTVWVVPSPAPAP